MIKNYTNLFLLAPIVRNNQLIFLTTNGTVYKFLTPSESGLCFVDDNLQKELQQTYNYSKLDFQYILSDIVKPTYSNQTIVNKSDIDSIYKSNIDAVDSFFKNSASDFRNLVFSNLKDVKFKNIDEDKKHIEKGKKPLAYARDTDYEIYFQDIKNITNKHIMLHEMLHISVNKNNYQGRGLKNEISYLLPPDEQKNTFPNVQIENGTAINEGATEFYTSQILNEDPLAYETLVNMFDTLTCVCDSSEITESYFRSNRKRFTDELTKTYHLPNEGYILKFIYLMDAYHSAYFAPKSIKNSLDEKSILCECYKLLIDMHIHKMEIENTNIKDLTLDKIISPIALKTEEMKKDFFPIIDELKLYLSYKISHTKLDEIFLTDSQLAMKFASYFLSFASIGTYPPFNLKKCKFTNSREFYSLLLNNFQIIQKNNTNYKSNTLNTITSLNIVSFIFSKKLGIIPKDKDLDYVVKLILQSPNCIKQKLYTKIPEDIFVNFLNTNPCYAFAFFDEKPEYALTILPKLSNEIKNDRRLPKYLLLTYTSIDKSKSLAYAKQFVDNIPNEGIKKCGSALSYMLAKCEDKNKDYKYVIDKIEKANVSNEDTFER